MNESDELINIIDSRVNKVISGHRISFKYPAIVKDISNPSGKIGVELAGDSKTLYFLNKSSSALLVGDSVYVEAIGGDLTNGVISLKYGGDKGIVLPGEIATIQVGETITGEPGTNANVINSGTPTNIILSFTIPRGKNGKSSYEIAVEEGYSGSETEFYAALVGLKDAPFLPMSGGTLQPGSKVHIPQNGLLSIGGAIGSPNINIWSASSDTVSIGGPGGDIRLIGIANPQSGTEAVNKQYVDNLVGDINTILDTINGEAV